MHRGLSFALKTLALALTAAAPLAARADIPPPHDYVEQCTVEKQSSATRQCQSCSAWHGERDACDKTLGKDGFTRQCKSYGASTWTEVWCKVAPAPVKPVETGAPATSAPTPAASSSKCAAGGIELGLGLLGALLVLARRTRIVGG